MKNLIVAFFMMTVSLVFLGCSSRLEEKRIDNVVRVFWHENTKYSVIVRKHGSAEIETFVLKESMCGDNPRGKVRIVADVPLGNTMWVRYVTNFNWNLDCLEVLEIHVHSEKDIIGGGWNHGKFGSGQTVVIE